MISLTAFISPYRADRDKARSVAGKSFIEVYLKCNVTVCEERDTKGLYKKALAGEIKNFTGVNDPYEPPTTPDVVVNSDKETPEESAQRVIEKLEELGYLEAEKTISGYTKEEEEKVNQRLADLGYL